MLEGQFHNGDSIHNLRRPPQKKKMDDLPIFSTISTGKPDEDTAIVHNKSMIL